MSKINIDIADIQQSLQNLGYEINDCIERENHGKNWQIKFSNSGASVTVYDSNKTKNTVVNGKLENGEKESLKWLVDSIKCKEFSVDPLNKYIVDLIHSRQEDTYYDFKECLHHDNESLLHDILCLANNTDNSDAYLIFGVTNTFEVVGVDEEIKSNNLFDFLRTISFAGDHVPEIEIKNLYYKYKHIVVIVCKSSKHVPFYLAKKYRGIHSGQIYTRIGDTNTPKNEHANYQDTERLWRIHFERENE